MTAQTIIQRAFDDLGVTAQSTQGITSTDLADALARLNNMVSGWNAMPLTILAIQRVLLPVVANQATYTIGPGGQYNVARPISVQGAALLLNGLSAPVSATIARSVYTATVTSTLNAAVGDVVFMQGADQTDYNGLQTVLSTTPGVSFTFNVDSTPTTPATGTITVQGTNSATGASPAVEIPRALYTDDAYQALAVKNLVSQLFTGVYYNPTQPLGQVFLWPTPNTDQNQLVLYLPTQFAGFVDLTTDYTYPGTAGYAEALEYNLALRLAAPYGRQVPPDVLLLATSAFATIKRANYKLSDLPIDAAFTRDRRGGYNIFVGNG